VHAGKVASVIMVLLVTTVATAIRAYALFAWDMESVSALTRIGLFACVVGLVTAVILVPAGFLFDRSSAVLRRQIDAAARNEQQFTAGSFRLLRPVTRTLVGAVDLFQQRERSLRNQLGELEIRHRVSEAEHRQVLAVLHALRDAVLVTDAFDELVMANHSAAATLGFDLQTAIHKPIDQIIVDPRLRQLIRDARETANFTETRHVELTVATSIAGAAGSPATGRELRVNRNDSSPARLYDVTLSCVENHKHEVGGVVTILHDLTKEREISQMKSDFVSKASHELRTPLSSIRAYIEMLVDGEANDEKGRQEFYRVIQNETDRLGRLIDNMLNISRIEAGIVQIDRENVDIKSLVHRAINTLDPQAKEKQIAVHSRLAAVDLSVEGDADMLYQVVLNLLSNAVKYTPEGGRVTVGGDSDNLTRCVLVTVSDTGLGIPPDSLPKLFDKFYRVENYKRVAKGTGLGLSLCKHIVETVHHGQIGVESKLGMGSKFWFSVPMRYAGSKAAA
jgi:two-component system, OmpR family, phosphate regulon sensor histidine kinase PhoR